MLKCKRSFAIFAGLVFLVTLIIFVDANVSEAAKKKKHYDDWRGVAADMALEFNAAIDDVVNDKYDDAYKHVNDAYFKYYEVQGVERTVMYAISAARVNHIEAQFRDIKHVLLGNQQKDKGELIRQIEALKIKVYKDSMVLDGYATVEDSDSVGEAIYADTKVTRPEILTSAKTESTAENITSAKETAQEISPSTEKSSAEISTSATTAESPAPKAPVNIDWLTFLTAFGLLVREGLEAILVIVAIVAYLIKTGNRNMLKGVYLGSFAAVIASVILAWALETLMGEQSGVARELLEGWTMFLAVAVLFYVSNWMLSKADNIAWENYISGKVQQSIDSKSQWTLIFAAFIAVMREGAELILFYSAAFTGGMSNPAYIAYGIAAGVLVLVIVWVCFRYFSVRLPLRAFFMFTSILLFLMCISFMGKGVVELTEADVITGRTVIPAMKGFSIEILSIYDRAETLIPQIMLVIAAVWIMLPHIFRKKDKSPAK